MFAGFIFICCSILSFIPSAFLQEHTRPFIDQRNDMLLAPLKHLPLKSCQSKMVRKDHLFCCTTQCYRHPMNRLTPVLQDYYIDCYMEPIDCTFPSSGLHIADIEAEMDPIKELIPKERKKEMLARMNPFEIAKRFAKWFVRLVLGWMFHKLFTRLLELAKVLIQFIRPILASLASGA